MAKVFYQFLFFKYPTRTIFHLLWFYLAKALWELILNDGYRGWIIGKVVGGVFKGGGKGGVDFFLAFQKRFFLGGMGKWKAWLFLKISGMGGG